MSVETRELDALPVGVTGREYTVATYRYERPRKPLVTAYSRVYNPEWDTCVMYRVKAPSAAEARAAAIRHRKANP